MKITFRSYIDKDWTSICNVFKEASKEEIKGCCDIKALRPLESYKQVGLLKNAIKICACDNDIVIGYIAFSFETMSILSLYVLPKYIGKKIGKTLLSLALINLGVNVKLKVNNQFDIKEDVIKTYPNLMYVNNYVVNILCMTKNKRAMNLYNSYGFIITNTSKELLHGYPCLYSRLCLYVKRDITTSTITNSK